MLFEDAVHYQVDFWQRSVLFLNTLRQRADNIFAHDAAGMPPLLDFDYELILDIWLLSQCRRKTSGTLVSKRTEIFKPASYWPHSSTILLLGGILLVGLGLYFIFLRPPLLPEDLRYMGTSLEEIRSSFPGLLQWLPRVFWVMGGFILSTGILTCYLAKTNFRSKAAGAAWIVAATGLTSIGWMVVVNFIIDSDFKLLLLLFTSPWVLSLWLFYQENKWTPTEIG